MRQQGGMPEKADMYLELRKLGALKLVAQITIEKWRNNDSINKTEIEAAARSIYSIASDFEAEMAAKYGISRDFAFEMESIFGEVVIEKLFKIPKTK